MHPEAPATGHLDTAFLRFPSLQANAERVPQFRVILTQAARFKCINMKASRFALRAVKILRPVSALVRSNGRIAARTR
jgi:hypothetical protein